jgi:hypothetical protein
MSNVVGFSRGRHADLQQAGYYQSLLDDLRAEVIKELADHRMSLVQRERIGDFSRMGHLRRVIQAKEAELTTLNQLTHALNTRFPTSQTYHADIDTRATATE